LQAKVEVAQQLPLMVTGTSINVLLDKSKEKKDCCKIKRGAVTLEHI
jgi:hypothetical protein